MPPARPSRRFAWREAYEAYSSVDRKDLTPEDFESFGDAAWWSGKLDDAIKQRERAYAGFSAAGDKSSAARLALALAWDHEGRAAYAVSQGWFGTAQRLLEDSARVGRARETPAHGCVDRLVRRQSPGCAAALRGDIRARSAHRRPGHAGSRPGRQGPGARDERRGRAGPRSPRRSQRRSGLRRATAVRDRDRLLHGDQLVPGRRRLQARGRVDRSREPVVRRGRCQRISGHLPVAPRRDHAPAR